MSKFFVVNETVFLDIEPKMISDQEYHDYRLYKVMKKESGTDVHKDEEELSELHLTEDLYVTYERFKQGLVINNNVYVTYEQWNTIRLLEKDLYSCSVCHFQCDGMTVATHLGSIAHVRRLDGHRPLKRFDLSIIRKINENLHCAVCNTLFPITNYGDHENSKAHEGNLLFAINKVSDLMSCTAKKSTQSLNTNNIQAPNNTPYTDRNRYIEINRDYQQVINNAISNTDFSNQSFWDDTRNFENSYKDIKIYEEEDIEEYTLPIEGVSYASMASKPRVDLPKFLKIDLGAKEVRVKYESWNMITQTDIKHYYCMVCTTSFLVRFKTHHCLTEHHRKQLDKCVVVGAFEDYLIRDVSDKFYHCGHCNNLQYKSDMQIHVEKYHPMKNPKPMNNLYPLPENPKSMNNQYPLPEDRTQVKTTEINKLKSKLDIFGEFKFCPFGIELTVSHLGCHALMLVNNRYHCALCDLYVQGELIEHVYEMTHMQFINMTPFIRPFQCNLTRAIRGSLHCALCNILIPVSGISDHNITAHHTTALAKAMGMVKNEPPKHETKYQANAGEFKNELERFLATLPPASRESLCRFKLKNHKGEMFQYNDTSNSSSSSDYSTPIHMSVPTSPTHKTEESNQDTHKKPDLHYPKPGISGINPIIERQEPIFRPGQLLTISMIESGLPGVRTGSPVTNGPPVQLQISGPLDLSVNRGVRIPVSPVRQPQDIEVANELLSLYNQSPVRRVVKNAEVIKESKKEKCRKGNAEENPVPAAPEPTKSDSNLSIDDEEQTFKLDEAVLLKLKSLYFKVSSTSFHSLVHTGNGLRFCFICSYSLDYCLLQKHVESREHVDNMLKHKFLSNFCGQLFRQMYLMYHCAICNVTMSRKEVKSHIQWATHIEKYEQACKKLNKKVLKELRTSAKEYSVETQKEFLYVNVAEPTINMVTYIQSVRKDLEEAVVEQKLLKKSQMIILKGIVMKINFESWHGVLTRGDSAKCIVCQLELTTAQLTAHLRAESHAARVRSIFDEQYYPALIRKINDKIVNCLICNLELSNDDTVVSEHISGRKHEKNYNTIIDRTARADSYSDCNQYAISL